MKKTSIAFPLVVTAIALASGCGIEPRTNPFDPETPDDLQARSGITGVVFSVAPDGTTSELAGARVTLTVAGSAVGETQVTEAGGAFAFPDQAATRYRLEVTHSTHIPYATELELEPGIDLVLEARLLPIPQNASETSGHVFGVVQKSGELTLDQELRDHSGVVVEVEVDGAGIRTTTNVDGRYDLYLAAGSYDLYFSAPEHIAQGPINVVVVAGESTEVSDVVLLSNPGQVTGTVLLEGVAAGAHGGTDVVLLNSESTQTDIDGTFVINGVPAGTFTLVASRPNYDSETLVGITVHGGRTTDVPTLRLRRSRGRVIGQVELLGTDSDYSGATISLGGTAYGAVSSTSGEFALEDVVTGTYDLSASKDEYTRVVVGAVTVTADTTEDVGLLTLVKQQGTFRIDGGLDYTNDPNNEVTLNLVAPDGSVEIRITGDLDTSESTDWRAYDPSTPLSVLLSPNDGTKSLTVTFRDADEVESPSFSDSIVVDHQPPQPIAGLEPVLINGGAAFTANTAGSVTLTFNVVDPLSGVSHVRVSNDGLFDNTPAGEEWRAYVGTLPHTLADYGTQGPKTVYVIFRDFAGNETILDEDTTVSVILDTSPPQITDAGLVCPTALTAGFCRTNTVRIEVTATDNYDPSGLGASWIALANEEGFIIEDFRPFLSTQTWLLSPTDELKTVHIKLRDAAGNPTNDITRTITLDTAPPTGASLSIDQGAFVDDVDIDLTVGALNADSMRFDIIDTNGTRITGDWLDYDTGASLTLPGSTEGAKTVEARFRDLAGNEGNMVATATTVLDTIDPTGDVVINGDAARTTNNVVALNLSALDVNGSGVVSVRLANTQAALDAATPVPMEPTKIWTLTPASGPNVEETRYVWLRFVDRAGNESADASDDILIDLLGPTGTITPAATRVADTRVDLSFTYSADTTHMKLSPGNLCAGGNWVEASSSTQWTLAQTDGPQTASVRFRDGVGNESGCEYATITLDTTGPSPASFTVAGNGVFSNYTNSTSITVNTSSSDGDCVEAQLAEDLGFLNITHTASSCTLTDLSYGLASNTEGPRDLFVRFMDDLGNIGEPAHAVVILDTSGPQASAAGFAIVQGNLTNQTSVDLNLLVSGADQVQISEGTCSGSYVAFTPTAVHAFVTTTNELKTIAVRYRDLANNTTACFAVGVTLDTQITTPTLSLSGPEAVAGRTASPVITVTLSGLGADHKQMKVSNQEGLGDAGWMPVSASTQWLLSSGQGIKTVYVVVSDAAGNETGVLDQDITLDQSGPETPSLQVTDVDPDGFPLSQDTVELAWNNPLDAAGYELQRFVPGVDATFVAHETFGAGDATFIDDVTATVGRIHYYQIRAFDDLGNTSAWSVSVSAVPFQPITEIDFIRATNGWRYSFNPMPGTFNLMPRYAYQDAMGETVLVDLAANVPTWFKTDPSTTEYNGSLTLRCANQDNTLVYESEIPLWVADKLAVDTPGLVGEWSRVLADSMRKLHILYADGTADTLKYATNASGAWVTGVADSAVSGISHLDAAIDDLDTLHVAYHATGPGSLYYAVKPVAGAWTPALVDNAVAITGYRPSIAVDSGRHVHIAYQDRTNLDLRYATNTTGSWIPVTLDATADDTGHRPSLGVDSNDELHIAYGRYGASALRYATNVGGSWSYETIAAVGVDGIGLGLDGNDMVHIAFADGDQEDLSYATGSLGSWSVSSISSETAVEQEPSLAMDELGVPHVIFEQEDVGQRLAVGSAGAWTITDLDVYCDNGRLSLDRFGKLLYSCWQGGNGDLLLYSNFGETSILLDTIGTVGSHADLAIDNRDKVHIAYNDMTAHTLKYTTNASGFWKAETITSIGSLNTFCQEMAVVVDSTDIVRISFYNRDADELQLASGNAGAWTISTIHGDLGTFGGASRLVIDGGDRLHVVTDDQINGQAIYTTNATGSWVPEVLGAAAWDRHSIAVDGADNIHISYANGGEVRYASSTNGFASIVVDSATYETMSDTAITADSTGAVHIIAVRKYDGALRYITNTTGSFVATTIYDNDASIYSVIDVDSSDHLHIVNGGFYTTNASGGWVSVRIVSWDLARYTGLEIDGRDEVYFSSYDWGGADLMLTRGFTGKLYASDMSRVPPF